MSTGEPTVAADPGRPDEVVLSVEDLRVRFDTPGGEVKAVDGVSFDVRAGEVFAVIGRTCASVLGAPSPLTQWVHGDTWYRYFPGRDVRLSIRDGKVGALRLQRSQRTLGTVEAVRSTWTRERCGELVWPLDDRAATPQALPF